MRVWRGLAILLLLPAALACADELLINAAARGNSAEIITSTISAGPRCWKR
jgi:hypothetical protein